MSDSTIDSIRSSYDGVADAYADALYAELVKKPFDCEQLTRFAGETSEGRVCDLGCGPGQVARFLHRAGADVVGIDLSPGMIDQARRLNPGMEFREGNMLALDLEDSSLAGVTAFYSIVNLPPDLRPQAFREMARVLVQGGLLLLTFHIEGPMPGDKVLFGRPITMDFYMPDRATVEAELVQAGFEIEQVLERGPYPPPIEHQSRRAYIFARKR